MPTLFAYFFDSHHVLLDSSLTKPWSKVPVIRSDGDGIHITFEARKLIMNHLVNGLELMVADGSSVDQCHQDSRAGLGPQD